MKYTLFLSISFSTCALFATTLSTQDIDQKVAQIQAPRGGMNTSLLNQAPDPFIYYDRNKTTGALIIPKEEDEDNAVGKLSAIMNGKAFIGGAWKKIGDMVGEYKITRISSDIVYLSNGKKTKKIHLNKNSNENKLIKF